jgi:hypothetical protein
MSKLERVLIRSLGYAGGTLFLYYKHNIGTVGCYGVRDKRDCYTNFNSIHEVAPYYLSFNHHEVIIDPEEIDKLLMAEELTA